MNFLALVKDGTTDNFTLINTLWGLDTTKAAALAGYMNYLMAVFVPVGLLDSFGALGYTGITDLAYLQFAVPHITTGLSLYDLQTLPGYPEPWAYAEHQLSTTFTLSLANSKALLSGTYNLTDAMSFGALLQYGALGDNATINGMFGSTFASTDAQMLAGYLNYLLTTFVDGYLLQPLFDAGGGFTTTRTVDEWLWSGTDPLLAFLVSVGQTDSAASNLFLNHTSMADAITQEAGKADTIKTGKDDLENIYQYVEYEETATYTGIWASDEPVKGTDATQFAPDVEKDEVLQTWVSELVRVIDLTFKEEVTVKKINIYRFELASHELDIDPNYYQTRKGMANMSAASDGLPLFVGKPHFLDADPALATAVTGVSPNASIHDTFIDVEPISGATMQARKRLQVSFLIRAGDAFTTNVTEVYMPLVWVEEGATIPDDTAEEFRDKVYGAQDLQDIVLLGGPTVGILLLGTAAAATIFFVRKP
jgi:hypothetical protein